MIVLRSPDGKLLGVFEYKKDAARRAVKLRNSGQPVTVYTIRFAHGRFQLRPT